MTPSRVYPMRRSRGKGRVPATFCGSFAVASRSSQPSGSGARVIVAELALAIALVGVAIFAYRRLTTFHPATLWLIAWAVAMMLYALRALPYRSLGPPTLVLIGSWTALFCLGAVLGGRTRTIPKPPRQLPRLRTAEPHLPLAAGLAAVTALAGLGLFLLQLTSSYGLRAGIVSDANVRLAIAEGATRFTVKYIYVAFAASSLAGLAASRSDTPHARRVWLTVAMVMIGSQYFSTGRSNILLAAVMAATAYFLGARQPIGHWRVLLVGAAVGVVSLAVFVGMGSLLGKSFEASDVQTFDNAFVRHGQLQPAALPYQYVTAPLPAFDRVREITPDLGRGGCRTLSPLCSVGQQLGLPVAPEPSLTGFTRPPSPWNTFTALYGPLVDGGPYLGAIIIFAEGLLFGLLWALALSRSFYGISAYAVMSSAVVYSTVENTLLQPHLVGAALVALLAIGVAVRLHPLASRCMHRWGVASGRIANL